MVASSWKRSRVGLPLIPNGELVWFIVRRLWCSIRDRLPFYSKEVKPDHKRAPTSMGENSSPVNGTLSQISIKRWRFSYIKG
jgi:hypothetical protein